jgi:hypothetical protein
MVVGLSLVAAGVLMTEVPSGKPLMRDFIGINTHTIQFKPEQYRPVASLVRNYHPAEWDLGNDPKFMPPLPKAKNGVDWGTLYGSWKKAGWRTSASVMVESVPLQNWGEMEDHIKFYGKFLAVALGPTKGERVLEAIEIGNEPEKWDGPTYRKAFAAMAKGIREGDPRLLISTCAVAVGTWDSYSKDVNLLKGLEGAYDILNIHTYAFSSHWPTWKRSFPEDPETRFLKSISEMAAWRDKEAPGKKIWVTEFGWDTTTQPRPTEGGMKDFEPTSDMDQARWIVRTFLCLAAMPVDRAYLYWFDDNDEWGLHAGSGITRRGVPKPSFFAMSQLQSLLGDFRYDRMILERDNARIAQFTSPSGEIRWAAWSASAGGSPTEVTVQLPFPIESAVQMATDKGEAQPLTVKAKGSAVTFTITESPSYLVFKRLGFRTKPQPAIPR